MVTWPQAVKFFTLLIRTRLFQVSTNLKASNGDARLPSYCTVQVFSAEYTSIQYRNNPPLAQPTQGVLGLCRTRIRTSQLTVSHDHQGPRPSFAAPVALDWGHRFDLIQ